ncbi:MAG: 50S ribosomal protein L23 [Candidatus Aerophobetes bacterium ADurb.Bin490]|nr:MAG: 50S ribosomal protein L23 [Candidatus Aerophobetes bacterium ADurb.Bin490]HNZ29397.1 50S ribosomal protein L23 [Candidatus Goldiibacteriota bacterium]HPI03957.1 50S ribosomal protein L23 [Candidatus Goldiibacteriota bacterium]HRQ42973.1 50S ribosomal protein L23 [Candidatus Goldiibacteriota bacterium]
MDIYQIIKKPSLTEKSSIAREKGNFYTFEVDSKASKKQIKEAVEKIFKVKVLKINTANLPGKAKRFGRQISAARKFKKAIVQLKKEDKIEIVEGV